MKTINAVPDLSQCGLENRQELNLRSYRKLLHIGLTICKETPLVGSARQNPEVSGAFSRLSAEHTLLETTFSSAFA
jgi:hypothetical protein